jgi:uncharacterized protein
MFTYDDIILFEWDEGNSTKNQKHHVESTECEEVFFDSEKVILKDKLHSHGEERYIVLGKTKKERLLFIVYTVRNKKLRVISARDINKKEIKLYEK